MAVLNVLIAHLTNSVQSITSVSYLMYTLIVNIIYDYCVPTAIVNYMDLFCTKPQVRLASIV